GSPSDPRSGRRQAPSTCEKRPRTTRGATGEAHPAPLTRTAPNRFSGTRGEEASWRCEESTGASPGAARRPPAQGYLPAQPSGQLPVHRLPTQLLEQGVGAAEGAGAEEPAVGRHRAGVGRLDAGDVAEQRDEVARVAPPQDLHERLPLAGDEGADGLLGDLLPALVPVGARRAGRDGA